MQSTTPARVPKILSPRLRLFFGFLLGITLGLVLAGAISVPFYFESSTILYKFGLDRHLLRSGQVMGVVAGCLLLLQIILSARLKSLDRLFGLDRLFRFHRLTGIIIGCVVVLHPILVFIPGNRIFIPLQLRYWPEFVGLFLLLLIIVAVISSNWRNRLRLPFHRWLPIQRWTAVLIAIAFWIHVLSVNEVFEQKLLKVLAFCAMGLAGFVYVWIITRSLRNRRRSLVVSAIEPAGTDAVCLKITSNTSHLPVYLPGQFSFLTIFSPYISKEEHPFSIASTPTQSAFLEFIVRTTGDWTRQLGNIQPGDRVSINGPFGLFSHLQLSAKKEMVMIAGGIGITPLLSMLRHMADNEDQRKTTLIWSNQTRNHIIFPKEFQNLTARLNGLRIHHVLTKDTEFKGEKERLDQDKLKKLLFDCSISAAVFVCGPKGMMKDIYHALVSMGFSKRNIFMERFVL